MLRAHFGFRYAETMNVVSRQRMGNKFYLSIINGENFYAVWLHIISTK